MTAGMKTLVEMPLNDYDVLLAKCPATDREYEILKNGLITPYADSSDSTRTVVILCQPGEAELILRLAQRLHPGAAPHIRQYPAAD
jgi:hypothetical protein